MFPPIARKQHRNAITKNIKIETLVATRWEKIRKSISCIIRTVDERGSNASCKIQDVEDENQREN